jgi:hypothetical protein
MAMQTPAEFRKNAENCLKLARETNIIYAKMALIEMATEFRASSIWWHDHGSVSVCDT